MVWELASEPSLVGMSHRHSGRRTFALYRVSLGAPCTFAICGCVDGLHALPLQCCTDALWQSIPRWDAALQLWVAMFGDMSLLLAVFGDMSCLRAGSYRD